MLKSTHPIAGTIGRSRASPRLSLPPAAASSAIWWAAKAGSEQLRVEKTAPARAVLVTARETVGFGGVGRVMKGFDEEMGLLWFGDLGGDGFRDMHVADVIT